jgi:hypothetical protein
LEATTSPASFLGVTVISVSVGSDTPISAHSAVQAAAGSAVTMGARRSCDEVVMTVEPCAAML